MELINQSIETEEIQFNWLDLINETKLEWPLMKPQQAHSSKLKSSRITIWLDFKFAAIPIKQTNQSIIKQTSAKFGLIELLIKFDVAALNSGC